MGPSSHLWPLVAYASQPSCLTSTAMPPTACAPSTRLMQPARRASAHSSATGMRSPVDVSTCENDITRVRASIALANRATIAAASFSPGGIATTSIVAP